MTVQFFRLVIQGTDNNKLQTIKSWVESKLEIADFSDKVMNNLSLGVSEDEFDTGNYTFQMDAYIKDSVNKSKYRDIIVNQFTSLNKTGLTHAYIDKYDECSHDSDNPQPCVVTRVMEWNGE